MKRFCVQLGILTAILGTSPLFSEGPPPEILEAEIQELKTVLRSLRAENERLRTENRLLRQEMQQQPRSGSSVSRRPVPPNRTVEPRVPAQPPRTIEEKPVQPVAVTSGNRVKYVNAHWHYLIAEAGSEDGLTKGTRVQVQRQGTVLATAIVTELKPGQAVMDIDPSSLTRPGVYPAQGDTIAIP